MKNILFILSIISMSFTQQPKIDPVSMTSANQTKQIKTLHTLPFMDYQKFYIGFLYRNQALDVITLTIREIQKHDSTLQIFYTINSRNSRRDGIGEIDLNSSLIHFEDLAVGKISKPQDGKVVFESITKDSLSYWKLKEK